MVTTETGQRLPTITESSILGFFGEYRWLSNFHLVPIYYDGLTYPCTEAAYMAHKTEDLNLRQQFTLCNGFEAKKLGRTLELRPDWDRLRVGVMLDVLLIKYKNPVLHKLLLDTGNKYLEETNNWGDFFWGVCKGKGMNMLGQLTMAVREAYRKKEI